MNKQQRRRTQQHDTYAKYIIKASGVLVIASMVSIFVFLVIVAWPLMYDASNQQQPDTNQVSSFANAAPLQLGVFNGSAGFYAVSRQGEITWFQDNQQVTLFESQGYLSNATQLAPHHFNLLWQSGLLTHIQVLPPLPEHPRPRISQQDFALPPDYESPLFAVVRRLDDSNARGVFVNQAQQLRCQHYRFSDTQTSIIAKDLQNTLSGSIATIALGAAGRWLYVSSDRGELAVWDLESKAETPLYKTASATLPSQIESMAMVYGDFSVAVGSISGQLQTWGVTPREKGFQLSKLHDFSPASSGIAKMLPSAHDKTLLVLSQSGELSLCYTTSERVLLTIQVPGGGRFKHATLSEDNRQLLALDERSNVYRWQLDLPYSEVSFKTLWQPIWYEGYPGPTHTWQSSAATDAFEPKISLLPLLFGTLKGTFYSMLFALPISILAAMYVSHLMHPQWRNLIKPLVELMAGLPSVIIGFIAALVLAPILERNLLAICVVLPVFLIMLGLFLITMKPLQERLAGREFFLLMPLSVFAVWLAIELGGFLERSLFDAHFDLWLFETLGIVVEQRNALVIAIGLGFAVMPLIFTIAEDALHNVPRQYTAASLALGSSQWQTLRYVVLPIAKPGILAAIMIGLGRAIGETMIVLMATGNTPIMSMDLFQGMRTLAANIAIEIGEAPADSMLFRVLFLSALLLFVMTFIINTLAEIIRNRLQQKYQQM